jgi:hypothetical protein
MRATPAQTSFLTRLANQCFAKRITIGYDMRSGLHRISKSEASAEIDRLKRLLNEGEKRA